MILAIIKNIFISKPADDIVYGALWSLSVSFIFIYLFAWLIAHAISSTSGIDNREQIDKAFKAEARRQRRQFEHQQKLKKANFKVDRYPSEE